MTQTYIPDTIIQNNLYFVKTNSVFHNICSYIKDHEIYASIDGHTKTINIVPKDKFIPVLKEYSDTLHIRYYYWGSKITGPSLSKLDYYKILDKIDSEFYREISNKSFIRIKDKKLFTKLKLML